MYKSKWQKTAVNKNWKYYYILINISNLHGTENIIEKVIKYKNNISKINSQFYVINSKNEYFWNDWSRICGNVPYLILGITLSKWQNSQSTFGWEGYQICWC